MIYFFWKNYLFNPYNYVSFLFLVPKFKKHPFSFYTDIFYIYFDLYVTK